MAKATSTNDPILAELTSIKRLLTFALLQGGASQAQVAGALGVDQSAVSRMFSPPGKKRQQKKLRAGRGSPSSS